MYAPLKNDYKFKSILDLYTMIFRTELKEVSEKALTMVKTASIQLADTEAAKITATDFGLSRLKEEGIQILI